MTTCDLVRLIRQSGSAERGALPFPGAPALGCSRVHEFQGPARRRSARVAARATRGRSPDPPRLAAGTAPFPGRGLPQLARPASLRQPAPAGVPSVARGGSARTRGRAPVIAELPETLRFTPARRLELAAETGARQGTGCRRDFSSPPGGGAGQSGWQFDRPRPGPCPRIAGAPRHLRGGAAARPPPGPRRRRPGGAGFTPARIPATEETAHPGPHGNAGCARGAGGIDWPCPHPA